MSAVDDVNPELLNKACNGRTVNLYNGDTSIFWSGDSGKYEFGGHRLEPGESEYFEFMISAPET